MKKVPVKVFYVELFLHRFDVYPNQISPLSQLGKDDLTRRLRNSNKWKGTGYEKKSKE